MSDRNPLNIYQPGSVRCPVCLRSNRPGAALCVECGSPLTPAHVAPGETAEPGPTERQLMKDTRWMQVYGALAAMIGVVLFIVALVTAGVSWIAGNNGRAMFGVLAAIALIMANGLISKGLWRAKRWALNAALAVHGTLLFYGLAQLARAIWRPNIPYLDMVLWPAVGLMIVGIALVWIGLTDRGFQVDGQPDPEVQRMLMLRAGDADRVIMPTPRVRHTPYEPETPGYYLNRHPDRDAPPWGRRIPAWLMLLGGFFLTRMRDGDGKGKRGRGDGFGLKDLFKMFFND